MKVSKRQLKRIIREEKRRLLEQDVIPPREEHVDTYYDDDAYGQADAMADEWMNAVRDAILELFVMNGEVRTVDIFDHLKMNGMHQDEIDVGLDGLNEEY